MIRHTHPLRRLPALALVLAWSLILGIGPVEAKSSKSSRASKSSKSSSSKAIPAKVSASPSSKKSKSAAEPNSSSKSSKSSKGSRSGKSSSEPKSGPRGGDDDSDAGAPSGMAAWVATLDQAAKANQERWSIFVKDMDTGEVILTYAANDRLIPASNRKIMIFALAMEYLGPEHRFKTEFGLARPSSGGPAAPQSVVLRSNGDPTMEPRFLNQKNPAAVIKGWVSDLRARGVTRVAGNVLLDASAFGGEQDVQPDAWGGDHINFSYAPRPSALAMNGNLIEVRAFPRGSGAASVDVFPCLSGLSINNETHVVSGRSAGLDARFTSDNSLALDVTGRLGSGSGMCATQIPVGRPLDYVRALVENEFKAQGIQVAGAVRVMTDPAEARSYPIETLVDMHESPPLIELLQIMMRDSDNFLAEQIWRATAFRALGKGDPAEARRLERRWLKERGLTSEPGYDGSGLSRKNAVSAMEVAAVLEKIYRGPYQPFLLRVLPESGRSGTLRGRSMGGQAGRVAAKTGTLSGAQALSGFIRDTQGRERWVFSMLGNAPANTNGRLKMRQDQIMKILFREMDSGGKPRSTVATSAPHDPIGAPTADIESSRKRARPDLNANAKGPS